MEKVKEMLNYWRNSLADADLLSLDINLSEFPDTDLSFIRSGKIDDEVIVTRLFKSNMKNGERSLNNGIHVLLCPLVLKSKYDHGKSKGNLYETVIPIWVPAKLNKAGELFVDQEILPWISRNYLEPCFGDTPIIGNVSDLDQFLTVNSAQIDSWKDLWSFVEKMFSSVTSQKIDDFALEDYQRMKTAKILTRSEDDGVASSMSSAIIQLYDELLKREQIPQLLTRYLDQEDKVTVPLLNQWDSFDIAKYHRGQMSNHFPVSPSQREAIHHFSTLDKGDILAINGPPGTGKTTLLQSIVASLWVEAAYKETDPPIIVATSTNNQAVTNIIESFGKVEEVPNPLQGRWLPDIHSYGLYLPSATAYNKSKSSNWQMVSINTSSKENKNDETDFPHSIETDTYVRRAEEYYIKQCETYARKEFHNLASAVSFIHQEIKTNIDLMQRFVETVHQFALLNAKIYDKYPDGIDMAREQQKKKIERIENELQKFKDLEIEWNTFNVSEPWWYSAFSIIPFVRRKRTLRNKGFFLLHQLPIDKDQDFESYIQSLLKEGKRSLNDESGKLEEIQHLYKKIIEMKSRQHDYMVLLNLETSNSDFLEELDTKTRYKAFKLATHYWEGQWLLEIREQISTSYNESKAERKQKKRWHRYAKLTPCFVSTFHSLPRFFQAWQGKNIPLYEYIDLLIVDEAGQVRPEIAGASFALAKKALAVGDIFQIKPIWDIPKTVDVANIISSGAASLEEMDNFFDKGLAASSGSVMVIAQRASRYQKFEDIRGLYLTEHRRCVPEIIQYCNELAYQGRLEPRRKSNTNYPLPPLGYAHIPGTMQSSGGSHNNPIEADVIVHWILDNKLFLQKLYPNKSLDEIIAVITPFTKQRKDIQNKLKRKGYEKVVVGTVHALQGAERPIIIFSPVYDIHTTSGYFFDHGVNMLNVAVSRAKDSFLVFGDMGIFNSESPAPSGKLARYLFANEKNEIKNVKIPNKFIEDSRDIIYLRDVPSHNAALLRCVQTAKKELTIVSPFLSSIVIKDEPLEKSLKDAIDNGKSITVYTDPQLNQKDGSPRLFFSEALQLLGKLGINVIFAKRIHNKSLWRDHSMLIEGSFNWFSARRKETDPWCRYETSIVYRGDQVEYMILKVEEDLKKRLIPKIKS
ncbi:AAA domain-containing protein [Sporolactobacillus pectinivorans]|uniref:AAA domain-containing protein n=1 Tax=Sporolactobacillus pectinivorans TaxID=1591408 RepID=UPI000C261D34|nr:AAA domain-containing protein [Sporolactobacillus pectinivorans]